MAHDAYRGRSPHGGVRLGALLLSTLSAVSWSFLGMIGTAALGLHLLGADAVGSLGPITAAAVALAVGGKVAPDGDVRVFGLEGADAEAAIDVVPLGVSLVGALLLAYFFLRSLRRAGAARAAGSAQPWVPLSELVARVAAVVLLFTAVLGGLAWAGHSTVTMDGKELGLGGVAGDRMREELRDRLGGGVGDIGGDIAAGIGGGMVDGLGDLARLKAAVGFRIAPVPTLAGGALWALGVLLIALAVSRRTPLPVGRLWQTVHSRVRPAASALVLMLLLAVGAGLAAAAYAAVTDDHPRTVAGAALLGAPNGVWLAVPLGLFVSLRAAATGMLVRALPAPLDELLAPSGGAAPGPGKVQERTLGVADLAELDKRVWLLVLAVALMLLTAGVLTATRTPRHPYRRGPGAALAFAARCGLWLGLVTGLAMPLLTLLTGLSADAGLTVMGFNAVGAKAELHGSTGQAALLGGTWGAAAGFVGALLACVSGAAGRRASPLARGAPGGPHGPSDGYGRGAYASDEYPCPGYPTASEPGPYRPPPAPAPDEPNPYKQQGTGTPQPPYSPYSAPTIAGEPIVPPHRPQPPPPGPGAKEPPPGHRGRGQG